MKIGILQVPDFIPGNPLGGAEAIADRLARELSASFDVLVCHGHDVTGVSARHPTRVGPNLTSIAGFPRNEAACLGGVLACPVSDEVRNLLSECRVLFCFERILQDSPATFTYAVLGGICYAHCWEVARSGLWDRLIVPSRFLFEELSASRGMPLDRVTVIPNGIDLSQFCPGDTRQKASARLTALVPSRPDWGKGFERAIALTRCWARRKPVTIHCFRQKSFAAAPAFYDELQSQAQGVDLVMREWVNREDMPLVYQSADVTLCLGHLPEGFGLTAIESIACGTPVLARPLGFLRAIIPPRHGLFYDDESLRLNECADRIDELICQGQVDCLERGIPYIKAHYSEALMIAEYRKLLANCSLREERRRV